MATPIVATGAAALSFYIWLRRWKQCGYAGTAELPAPFETHARTFQPPTTWAETLYLFKEAVRYVYQETLGRWHAIDLFFGLAYLSRRSTDEYPAADIAAAGQPLHGQHMQPQEAQQLILQLQQLRRYMLYCQGLKHHKPELQLKHWRITTGLEPGDILKHSPIAGLLRPAYVVFREAQSQTIILCVRGTHSRSDMFTSLTGTVKPHHVVMPEGVALGYSHLGMLAAARWLLSQTKQLLISALNEHPGYKLHVVGHSMGGGTAAMLTMMMREKVPQLSSATAWAIACPACMTLDLAASCAPFVTSLVHGTDIVPTFSAGAVDRLRDEVTRSSWFAEFQIDVQQRLADSFTASVRTLRLGQAGEWTQRNILSAAAMSFRSCYSRAPQSCYTRLSRPSHAAAAAAANHESPPVTPHAAAAAAAAAAAPQHRSYWGFSILSSRHARQQQQQWGATATGMQLADRAASPAEAAAAEAADEATALLLAETQEPASPLQWLKSMGARGRRPGFAAAAAAAGSSGGSNAGGSSGSGRRSSEAGAGGVGQQGAATSEAVLVEQALRACLLAADAGQLEATNNNTPSAAGGSGAGGAGGNGVSGSSYGAGGSSRPPLHQALQNGSTHSPLPPAAAYAASGGTTAAGRGAALASNIAKAASRVVLRTKRPQAPGKKHDDGDDSMLQRVESSSLQRHSRLGDSSRNASGFPAATAAGAASAAGAAAGGGGGGGWQLPVSTAATTAGSGVHAGGPLRTAVGGTASAAAAAGAAGSTAAAASAAATDALGLGPSSSSSIATGDPAAAASTAAKPKPSGLRSRRGWAGWGDSWGLEGGPGSHSGGWVSTSPDSSSRRSSLAGGRRVVEYLGHTVGQTGRLVAETTGQLLRSSSSVLFQTCTVPVHHPAAAVAAAAEAGAGGSNGGCSGSNDGSSGSNGGRCGIVVAPSSSSGMDRDEEGPLSALMAGLSAAVADAATDDDSSDGSDSDPDLQEGVGADEAVGFGLLDRPALRGNISALMAAAVSSEAAAAGGQGAQQEEEDQAAEKLLHDIGTTASEASLQQLSQLQEQATAAAAAVAAAAGAGRSGPAVTGSSSNPQQQRQRLPGSLIVVSAGSLRRNSPLFPSSAAGAAAASGSAAAAAAAAAAVRSSSTTNGSAAAAVAGHPSGGTAASSAAAASGSNAGSNGQEDRGNKGDDGAAERLARRRMYPAGRVLHLMPRCACPDPLLDGSGTLAGGAAADGGGGSLAAGGAASGGGAPAAAAAAADDTPGSSSQQQQQQSGAPSSSSRPTRPKLPPLTAAQDSVGLGDPYVLLEVPNAEVYGRVKLCPSMVRDHFIPSYLRALDSVLGQLQQVAAQQQQ